MKRCERHVINHGSGEAERPGLACTSSWRGQRLATPPQICRLSRRARSRAEVRWNSRHERRWRIPRILTIGVAQMGILMVDDTGGIQGEVAGSNGPRAPGGAVAL